MLPAFKSIEKYYHGPQEMRNEVSAWFIAGGLIMQDISCKMGNTPFGGLKANEGYELREKLKSVTVLDACSGPGDFLNHLSLLIPNIEGTCVDKLELFTKVGEKQFPKFKHLNEDAIMCDLKRKFDYVVVSSGYHHIPDEDKVKFLKNIKRAMSKDTMLLIVENILPEYTDDEDRIHAVNMFYNEANYYLSQGNGTPETIESFEECRKSDLAKDDEQKVCFSIFQKHIKMADLRLDIDIPIWQPACLKFENAGTHVFVLKSKN